MKLLSFSCHNLRLLSFSLGLLMLAGCAEFNSGWNRYTPRYNDAYAQSDFDELLAFGDNMARLPASARGKQCRGLVKRQKPMNHTDILLHLMVGRLLSDACGNVSKILSELRSLPPGSIRDPRLQRLVSIHTEALERMGSGSRKTSVDCKQKSVQSASKPLEKGGSNKNENRMLREKLEAIRSMEKDLDESGSTQ